MTSKRIIVGIIVFLVVSLGVVTFAVAGNNNNVYREGNNVEVDNTAPVITLTGDSVINVALNGTFTDPGATATDETDGDLTGDIVVTGTVDTSVVGSYELMYNVIDEAGNNATTVTRQVNVSDEGTPTITLNGATDVYTEVFATYTDAGATANDPEEGDLTASIVRGGTVNINTVGTYTLTYNVSDTAENDAIQVIRRVHVVDTVVPVITLIGTDETVEVLTGTYTDAGATALDNYDGDITTSIVTVNPVDINTVGDYTVTYNVIDASGNVAIEVTRTVSVVDTVIPEITMIGTDEKIEVGDTYTDAGATALDNYDGDITTSIVTVNPVDINTAGDYIVTYNVVDLSNNAAIEVTRTVSVVETNPERLVFFDKEDCGEEDQGNAWETVEAGIGLTYNDWINAKAYDEFDDTTYYAGKDLTCMNGGTECYFIKYKTDKYDNNEALVDAIKVDMETLGSYYIGYRVYDTTSHSNYRGRWVDVVDTTAPVITLNGASTVKVEVNTSYTDAEATALDTLYGNVTADIVVVNPVDVTTIGDYIVTYNVTDASGNVATEVTRTVSVIEARPEGLIFFNKDDENEVSVGSAWETVEGARGATYTDWVIARSYDEFDNTTYYAGKDLTCMNGGTSCYEIKYKTDKYDNNEALIPVTEVNMTVLGSYQIKYRVYDETGNTRYRYRWVDVVDTRAPGINLYQGSTHVVNPIVHIEYKGTFDETYHTYKSHDYVEGNMFNRVVKTYSFMAEGSSIWTSVTGVDTTKLGTYKIAYNVTDLSGNVALERIRTVIVEDTTAPTLNLYVGSAGTSTSPLHLHVEVGTDLDSIAGLLGYKVYDIYDGVLANHVNKTTAFVTDAVTKEFYKYNEGTSSYESVTAIDTSILATYKIVYTVSDSHSNTTVKVRILIVEDTTAPMLTLHNLSHRYRGEMIDTIGEGHRRDNRWTPTATARDNYYSPGEINITRELRYEVQREKVFNGFRREGRRLVIVYKYYDVTYVVGTTYTATDPSGNSSTAEYTFRFKNEVSRVEVR